MNANIDNENISALPKQESDAQFHAGREEYLVKLERALHTIPYRERSEIMRYYEEYLLEATEEEVAVLGTPDTLAARILAENGGDVSAGKSSGMNTAVKIILLVLTSPVWLMLLLAWWMILLAALFSLAVIEISLAATLPLCVVSAVISMFYYSYLPNTLLYLGSGLVGGGLALLLYHPFMTASRSILHFIVFTSKWLWNKTGLGSTRRKECEV